MKSNILTEKILIVDSNIDYAKFIQNALKKDGYLCYIAVSYEEAINLTYEKIPDCIIVDYIISYIYNPFFNISFQIKTPAYLFVQFMQGWGKYTI